MTLRFNIICSLIIVLLFISVNAAYSQTKLSGEIGIDLENYAFSSLQKEADRDFAISRSQSNHFIGLRISGPIKTEKFATYSASAKIYGTYFHADAEDGKSNIYLKPGLRAYNTELSLFPQRKYPLLLYMIKSQDHSIRYEANNRSNTDLPHPELTIIRRYQSILTSKGAALQAGISNNINFSTEFQNSSMKVQRDYDFEENRDIFMVFTELLQNPTVDTHTVEIINTITDDSLVLNINYNWWDTIGPGENIFVVVDSGYNEILVLPFKYNPYNIRVHVKGDMRWKIIYRPPPTPNDMDQKLNNLSALLDFGGNGKFKNTTKFNYSASDESVQKTTDKLNNLVNNAVYQRSKYTSIQMMTTYTHNKNVVDTISTQVNKLFMN